MHFESKSQKLEADLKNLRKDFSKKVSEVVASQRAQASHQLPAQRQYTVSHGSKECNCALSSFVDSYPFSKKKGLWYKD